MKSKKKKGLIIGIICVAASVIAAAILVLTGVFGGKKEMVVGKDIKNDAVTEFYYTRDSSANPPNFLRYRFYSENGAWNFYHEVREGDHWPLTEADITVSEAKALTEEERAEFFELIRDGIVKARSESTESGGSGPWLYLYWDKDRDTIQEFSFRSYDAETAFEEFCAGLAENKGAN